MFCVYFITNLINGKLYVGETNNPHKRWLQHKNTKSVEKYDTIVRRAMLKYGSANFTFEIIEEFPIEKEALEAEIWWIAYLRSLGISLYNLTDGGEDGKPWLGKSLPQEMRDKISQSRIGKYGGTNNPMYGKIHTMKVKLKVSETNKKISDSIVEEIIRLSQTGTYTGRELAKLFNVSTAQISRIKNGKQRAL